MGSDLACLLLLLQSGEQSGWVLNPPKRRAGVSEGAPLAWKEALEARVAAPPKPVSGAERSPDPQKQPCTLYFCLFCSPGVLEPESRESPRPPYGQRDFPGFEVLFPSGCK